VIIGDAFEDVRLLYVDTAPFIYYTEKRAEYADKMLEIFGYVDQEKIHVITGSLTLTETLMKPLQEEDIQLADQYRSIFFRTRGITTTSITPKVGDNAAVLRAQYNLKTPDALHIATAIEAGCDAFLTNDLGLKHVKEISVLILQEMELTVVE
jgi:predicted nucleic acid-binding protein